ncbi:MAG TPA: LytR C-terminal domain-containing protein [Solirubrobacteraceae bacterium]
MILALSLSSDVKSIGAYAGFAAIIGLALLVILYFAQAREVRRLSDALEEQESRLRRVPAPTPTVATMPRPAAAVVPASQQRPPVAVAPGAAPASPPTATVAVPGARRIPVTSAAAPVAAVPASPDAPAAETATDVRPPAAETVADVRPPLAETVGGVRRPAAETVADPQETLAPAGEEPSAAAGAPAAPPVPEPRAAPVLPAATAAGAAAAAVKPAAEGRDDDGGATTTVRPAAVPLVARPVASAVPAGPHEEEEEAAAFEDPAPIGVVDPPRPRFPPAPGEPVPAAVTTPRVGGRGDGSAATVRRERSRDDAREDDGEGRHRGSRGTLGLLAVAIVLVGVLIFVANQLLASSPSPSHPPANPPATASGPAPATITVAVLNGTQSAHLASRVSSTLVGDGFKPGAISNAPSTVASTTVEYIHHADRDAAIEVAHALALTSAQVKRADTAMIAAATIAGRIPTVIALIGRDYAG